MDTFDYINDPLTAEQVSTLAALLQSEWTEKARDGLLVISGRFIVSPQLPIVGIRTLAPNIYRLFDSNAAVYRSTELMRDYIARTGRLPMMEPPRGLILRKKAHMYWCSFKCYESPAASRAALQILEEWKSDCKLRATLPTALLERLAFVAYSGVAGYPPHLRNLSPNPPAFAGYNVELKASDHPELRVVRAGVRSAARPGLAKWRSEARHAFLNLFA